MDLCKLSFLRLVYPSLSVFLFRPGNNFRVVESWRLGFWSSGTREDSEPSTARIKPSVGSAARSRDAEWMQSLSREDSEPKFFVLAIFPIL